MDKDKKICVFDIEGNSLNPDKIWVVSAAIFSDGKWRLKSTTDYDEMRSFFLNTDTLIGHNITLFDIPVVERILDIKIKADLIDTLALSWYLEPYRMRHGLAWWGEDFNIPKPVIQEGEWEGALPHETQEEFLNKMTNRCEEDVKINCNLIDKQWKDLNNLYDGDKKSINRLVKYLMFKIDCAREAERSGWRVDIGRCNSTLEKLIAEKEEKVAALTLAMPKVKKFAEMWKPDELYKKAKVHKKPKTFQKANGELSAAGKRFKIICDSVGEDAYKVDSVTVQSKELNAQGIKWMNLLEAEGLPETHEDPITYLKSEKEPNPNSHTQTKDWLFSLGWKPETFTFKREADGSTRKIEQVRKVVDGEKVLCDSVMKLVEKEPAIELLGGLSILSHRIPILQGFLNNADSDGYLQAQIQGLTNTLRFKHKVVVNLPSVGKPYGEDVRGCLIAPEGYELCGSDMSSLEDRTKQHYMWDYDPEYVKEMQTEDFDPHLDLAVVAGFLSEEEAQLHKSGVKKFSGERSKAKQANYACVYGAGGATVARAADMTKSEGDRLVEKYWERNWSVKQIAEDQKVKRCLDSSWLYNPVSRFWYSLRTEKDRFSTLNQGTGVFCFDMWIYNFRQIRPQLTGQMHDEVILTVKKGYRDEVTKLLKGAIQLTNKQLKLNRELDIDVQFGDSYAEIH